MFKRKRSKDDFAEEIKAHLQLEADDLKDEGLSEDEARRKARVAFGSVPAAQERFYLRNRLVWFDNLLGDIKFAVRQLLKNPGFAITAIFVLALGMGASVAIFGFVDAALLGAAALCQCGPAHVGERKQPRSAPLAALLSGLS